jgi:hypothetical protein
MHGYDHIEYAKIRGYLEQAKYEPQRPLTPRQENDSRPWCGITRKGTGNLLVLVVNR